MARLWNQGGTCRRLIYMKMGGTFTIAAAILVLAGCGDQGGDQGGDQRAGTKTQSGVSGLVHLGPQCPVETPGDPCEDAPAANVTVTVGEQIPGDSYAIGKVVASATTDADGGFRIAIAPGDYVVTADAGMSCELMDARVTTGAYSKVDIPCDTGIR